MIRNKRVRDNEAYLSTEQESQFFKYVYDSLDKLPYWAVLFNVYFLKAEPELTHSIDVCP